MPPNIKKHYVSLQEALNILQPWDVTEWRLREDIRMGKIPTWRRAAKKRYGRIFIKKTDLKKYEPYEKVKE